MRTLAIFWIAMSIITISIMLLLIFIHKKKLIIGIENRMKKIPNILNYIGVIFTVLALLVAAITLLSSIREPKIEIGFENDYGDYFENSSDILSIEMFDDGSVDFGDTIPQEWWLTLTNKGNKTAKNVIVQLFFDNIRFIEYDYIYDYLPIDHLHGLGGYSGLQWEQPSNEVLLPDQSTKLPMIPFGYAIFNDDFPDTESTIEDKIKMELVIYLDDEVSVIKEYDIIIEKSMVEKEFASIRYEDDIKYQHIIERIGFDEIENIDALNDIGINDLKFLYNYSLDKICKINGGRLKPLVLIFGRAYYSRYDNSGIDVEIKIQNDLKMKTNYFLQ